ncbi:MAG: asparagine synthetase B, partial [Lachnospiraceae bacterium]|nr:asparagine synthetase B [Lachnospiraceae bacterium]
AAKRHIPEFSANKKKLGFPVPIRVWLKEDKYYNKVLETLTSDAAKKYFDQDEVVKLMEEHRDGKADNSRKIWAIYVFLIWHKVYIEDDQAKKPA